jgi:anti-sigma factor RsiW
MSPSADHVPDLRSPTARELADLSALADGTLAPERRPAVQARIDASPTLLALYERERDVVSGLRAANASVRAPESLRARIELERPSARVRTRRTVLYGGGLAGALAVLVLALVLLLPGGSPGAPSISEAAALAARGASSPAPSPDSSNPAVKLGVDVESIYFPNWARSFGWRATGVRQDTIGGHRAVTVFYEWRGKRLAYTIVSTPALGQPTSAATTVNGIALRTLTLNGRTVVTWRRSGHTCVLSAADVSPKILQLLAAWKAPGLGRS